MQLDAGDVGIAVAKADEPAVMAALGNVDMTVAYPAVGKVRADKIARLAGTHRTRVAVDSQYAMEGLADAATTHGVLCSAGLAPEMVSSGSTPSLFNSHRIHHVTEIRVGNAGVNDYFVLRFGHCRLEGCALRVVATVVFDAVPGQALIDAGSKALSAKQLLRHRDLEMGYVVEYPEARVWVEKNGGLV
jgi:D-serine deaminase-like pyridoxal phosphate-dependent protein